MGQTALADINGEGSRIPPTISLNLADAPVPVVCDVSDPVEIRNIFARLDQEYGRIRLLRKHCWGRTSSENPNHHSRTVQKVFQKPRLRSILHVSRSRTRMLAAGRGSILNIGSLASTTSLGRPISPTAWLLGAKVIQDDARTSTEWGRSWYPG